MKVMLTLWNRFDSCKKEVIVRVVYFGDVASKELVHFWNFRRRRKVMKRKLVVFSVLAVAIFAFTTMASATTRIVGPGYLASIQAAVNVSNNGDVILVQASSGKVGTRQGAQVSKNVMIKPAVGHTITIQNGPYVPDTAGKFQVGFYCSGSPDGPSIQGFKFNIAFPIYAVGASKVGINGNTFTNPVQAITNWGGSDWSVSSNKINGLRVAKVNGRVGGGVGIFVGSKKKGQTVKNCKITGNTITGKVSVQAPAGTEFQASGIALQAVLNDSNNLPTAMTANMVDKNTIGLTYTKPNYVHACELSQLYRPKPIPASPAKIVYTNKVTNNVVTKTTGTKVVITPSKLSTWNTITNNKSRDSDLELDEVDFVTDDDEVTVNPF